MTHYVINDIYFDCPNAQIEEAEAKAYIERGFAKYGRRLRGVNATVDREEPDYITVSYDIPPERFDRIRRITGYLVGTLDRFNNGKRAEEADRVKHNIG